MHLRSKIHSYMSRLYTIICVILREREGNDMGLMKRRSKFSLSKKVDDHAANFINLG